MTATLLVPIALGLGLLLLSGLRLLQINQRTRAKRQLGIELLLITIQWLKLSQQHRGMHSGFLNGQHSLRPKLLMIEQEIAKLETKFTDQQALINAKTYAYLQSAFNKWHNIQQQPAQHPSASFQAHSSLIARLLDSLWDIADDFSITTHTANAIQTEACTLVRTLPALTESIGQIRALTMQVANSERCTPDKKLQLLFTLSKVDNDVQLIVSKTLTDELVGVKAFTDDIRRSVEDNTLSQQNPDQLFQRATQNIDGIFQLIVQGLTALKEQL